MSLSKTPRDTLLQIIKEKFAQLPGIMSETGIDCWLVFARETDANPDPVMNLVVGNDVVGVSAFVFILHSSGDFKKIAIVANYDAATEEKKDIWDEVIPYVEGIKVKLENLISKANPEKIALNYSEDDVVADGLSHGLFLKLSSILKDYTDRFTSSKPIIKAIRGRKTKLEIELITRATKLTEEINRSVTTKLKPGMTEKDIQLLFHQELDNQGVSEAWQRVSCPAVDAGPDKEFGHVGPSELLTKMGHTLHNDFGVKFQGYCSDLQRMWFFGSDKDVPEELIHAFETVKIAIQKAAAYIKPGVTGTSVDKVARDHVLSRGYDEFAHSLGHQVGTKVHDGGVLLGPLWEKYGDSPKGLVEENNVFTLELNVQTKNYGSVSLEEDIIVTKDGCRFLVPPQEKFIYLE
ncbi:MAG: M24 family metallopeptidase [Candidatus Hodarchaeales archaeon]|jgi:Xaa-Pro aminopeptidase